MSAITIIQAHWVSPPDWLQILADECQASSQAKVAKRLGYSAATVSLVLKGTYSGDLQKVEQAVRGALMRQTVACPVLGDIPAQDCLGHQKAPFSTASPERVRLYRACRSGCPHSRIQSKGERS